MRQISLRLPEKLYKLLKHKAKDRGISMNGLIVSMLWERGVAGRDAAERE